jgi:hypothetical protein
MSAPGQLGGRQLERLKKGELFALVRSERDCGCVQASVMRELLRRDGLKQTKRERKAAQLRRVA